MRIYGIIKNRLAVMLMLLYLPEWQKILSERMIMKKIHTAVTRIIIFFMVAALYICGRYEKAPDRIFTGKVSAPEGEWTIDISGGEQE